MAKNIRVEMKPGFEKAVADLVQQKVNEAVASVEERDRGIEPPEVVLQHLHAALAQLGVELPDEALRPAATQIASASSKS